MKNYEKNHQIMKKKVYFLVFQADAITAFNNTYRYLDDILNLDNPFIIILFLLFIPKNYN